jgi:hypothetical protein
MDFVKEAQALDKWPQEQGFTDPDSPPLLKHADAHRALATGVLTPAHFRHITIEELADKYPDTPSARRAQEQLDRME